MGQTLAATLNRLIDAQATDETPKSAIVESMASAANVKVNTVYQILQGEINCPPLERLAGFAKVLGGASTEALVAAAGKDGCSYPRKKEEDQVRVKEVMPEARYKALQQVADILKTALGL